jgi:hypothetical protein
MKRIRHNPEQIINKLREADAMLAAGMLYGDASGGWLLLTVLSP